MEDGIAILSPTREGSLVVDRGGEPREELSSPVQRVSFVDDATEGEVHSRERLLDRGQTPPDKPLVEEPQVFAVSRHHVDFLLQVRRSLSVWCLQERVETIVEEVHIHEPYSGWLRHSSFRPKHGLAYSSRGTISEWIQMGVGEDGCASDPENISLKSLHLSSLM